METLRAPHHRALLGLRHPALLRLSRLPLLQVPQALLVPRQVLRARLQAPQDHRVLHRVPLLKLRGHLALRLALLVLHRVPLAHRLVPPAHRLVPPAHPLVHLKSKLPVHQALRDLLVPHRVPQAPQAPHRVLLLPLRLPKLPDHLDRPLVLLARLVPRLARLVPHLALLGHHLL